MDLDQSQATVGLYCPLVVITAKYKTSSRNGNNLLYFLYLSPCYCCEFVNRPVSECSHFNNFPLVVPCCFFEPTLALHPCSWCLPSVTLVVQNCQMIFENNSNEPPDWTRMLRTSHLFIYCLFIYLPPTSILWRILVIFIFTTRWHQMSWPGAEVLQEKEKADLNYILSIRIVHICTERNQWNHLPNHEWCFKHQPNHQLGL